MKIPENAKKVFKGVIFDVYQWEQEMFDGSHTTYEALKRLDTVQVIATRNGKILMGFEEQPMVDAAYSFFSGKMEPRETPLETAQRELLEETGMKAEDWELIKTSVPSHKIEWTIYTFVARNCKKIQEPQLEPGEKIEVQEMEFEKFVDIVTTENFWGKEMSNYFLRLQKKPQELKKLKKTILG